MGSPLQSVIKVTFVLTPQNGVSTVKGLWQPHSPIQYKSLCGDATSQGRFLPAGGLLRLRGHLSLCPRVSPSSCYRSALTCTSDIAGVNPRQSMQADQAWEGGLGTVHTGATDPVQSTDIDGSIDLVVVLLLLRICMYHFSAKEFTKWFAEKIK